MYIECILCHLNVKNRIKWVYDRIYQTCQREGIIMILLCPIADAAQVLWFLLIQLIVFTYLI